MKYRVSSDSYEFREKKVTCYDTEAMTQEGRLAIVFLEKWGMVAAKEDGEDAAGRQKMALIPVDECVARAFEMSRLAMAEARRRGLVVELPDLNEINADNDRLRQEAEERQLAKSK